MSSEFGDFDAREVEPSVASGSSKAIEPGKYKAMIVSSKWSKYGANSKDTSNGKKLELTFEICSGEHTGHRVYANLNMFHSSEVTVKIAKAELSAICHATGVMSPKQPQQLHDIPMVIELGLNKYDKDGEEKVNNKILGYESTEKAAASKPKRETVVAGASSNASDDPF